MSGGARVAMLVALDSGVFAGVLASSAGFPEAFRPSVRFPIFGTAGTDDFNYREMDALDRNLESPHRVEIFEGGHAWLPADVAVDGVEWMEMQAMRSGLRPRDPRLIDAIFAKRLARADAQTTSLAKWRELQSVVVDFEGLADVAKVRVVAASLEHRPDVQRGLEAERIEEAREARTTEEVYGLRDRLASGEQGALPALKARVLRLSQQGNTPRDSSDRRIARRVLAGLRASSRDLADPELRRLLEETAPAPPAGGPEERPAAPR